MKNSFLFQRIIVTHITVHWASVNILQGSNVYCQYTKHTKEQTLKHTNPVNLENSSFEKSLWKALGLICLWASPPLVILQYLLCLGEKMVFGLLSRSLSFSRSFWLFGDSASSSFFSLLKRSRPVRMMCSSILRWRFMSDSTLSSRASLFTEDRAEDPGRVETTKQKNIWLT